MSEQLLRQNLVQLRQSNFLTQKQMDIICGHRARCVYQIEAGNCTIQLSALKRVSDFFKVSIDDLCRTDIQKHTKIDLETYYNSAQLSLRGKDAS